MKSVLAILAIWLLPTVIYAAQSEEPVPGEAPTAKTVKLAPVHPQVLAATPLSCPYCDMSGADLAGRDLTDANLTGANLPSPSSSPGK